MRAYYFTNCSVVLGIIYLLMETTKDSRQTLFHFIKIELSRLNFYQLRDIHNLAIVIYDYI